MGVLPCLGAPSHQKLQALLTMPVFFTVCVASSLFELRVRHRVMNLFVGLARNFDGIHGPGV